MIGFAEQKGTATYVYNTNGGYKWHREGDLLGFTATTVIIKHGSTVFICDENGHIISTRTA